MDTINENVVQTNEPLDMHTYLGIPSSIILPLHHTNMQEDTEITPPEKITLSVSHILKHICESKKKAFGRVHKIRRNHIEIKVKINQIFFRNY